jgi:DNA polymerase
MRNPAKYEEIYDQRLRLKREGNALQASLKLVLNMTYGAMKDKNNPLYDPRQANRVCIYGQVLLVDLMEHLEPYCEIIQSNTDGVLIRLRRHNDYDLIDDVCYEWEQRTHLNLEFEEFTRIYQKDVNNYVFVSGDNHWKSKGKWTKKLSELDYDLPIVNKALVEYMVNGTPLEMTILTHNDLKDFQTVSKITGKYTHILHGTQPVKEKCIRVFASQNKNDGGVFKVHARTGKAAKIPDTPEHCRLWNYSVNDREAFQDLDKRWYLDMAKRRLEDFCERIHLN